MLRGKTGSLLYICLIAISLLAGMIPPSVQAADDKDEQRPKIGLVLGGGGARGAAHVGVLKALKEMNIPIDYVTGTSMGSVVGSLYAIGLDPDEIEKILLGVDWDDLFSDRPNRPERIYRRKEDDSAAFLPVEWGWKGRVVLSSGVIAGQKLSFAFRDDYLYLAGHEGFDNLAYPFRAVATDLQTGLMFVPDKGNLLKIVRASMSIPGVFPPVKWEGRTLVDGYLARNLPVDICREMGADIIIAVDVGSIPEETNPDHFRTLGGINMQKGIINGRQNVDPMLELSDIIIRPILDISSRDFKDVGETIDPGYQATQTVAEQLKKLSVSPEEYAVHLEKHAYPGSPQLLITDIVLHNNTLVHDHAILKNITQQPGELLDLDQLKYDLAEIYDFGVFELIDFSLEQDEDDITLIITAEEKYYAPDILNFGLSYYGGAGNQSILDVRARWTHLEMNRFGAEQRTDIQLGQTILLRSEYYQPLTWNRIPFFALAGRYKNSIYPWYFQMKHWGDYKTTEMSIRPDLGLRLGHWGELRLGLDYGHLKASDRTGLSLAEFDGPRGGYRATLKFDKVDFPFLPRKGFMGQVLYFVGRPEFGSDLEYERLSGRISGAQTWGGNTFHLTFEGGTNFGTTLPEFDMFTLGGMNRLMGYQRDQLRGQRYALGQARWYHQIMGQPSPFSTSWYLVLQGEAGNAWYFPEEAGLENLHYTGSVGIVATTVFGPLTVAYGRSDDGNDSAYVTLGVMAEPLK